MNIGIVGAKGQLGSDLVRVLGSAAIPFSHGELDITNPGQIQERLAEAKLTAIINCAAYNLVDRAEDEPEQAFQVNAFGVRNLAKACLEQNVTLMHISTDHVFGTGRSESSRGWTETERPVPASVYAASKLTGEHFVESICSRFFIVRTCGLYGRNATKAKGNFVETMLRLSQDRSELKIVNDQFCTPTSTLDLAETLSTLISTNCYGVYHATNAGQFSWAEFASEIFRIAKRSTQVVPISSAEFGAKARRPAWSVLNCEKLERVIGRPMRPACEALEAYLLDRQV